jgi:hypothetical protein
MIDPGTMTVIAYGMKLATELLPLIARGVAGALDAYNEGTARINEMVAEDRPPTPAEWDALNGRISALRRKLHSDDI